GSKLRPYTGVISRKSYNVPLPDGRSLALGERCLVMGILNVTPDSFAERTRFLDPEAAVDAALRMQQDGADLVDVGGESTRPGADPIPAAEELARIMPVLRALAGRLTIPVSIDTSKADVARAAGVPVERLIVDPGIGFAKRPAHSYGVLARLPELASALDRPLLVGPSRKSFMRAAIGDRPAPERDWGTAGAVAAAVLAGAHIV